MFRQSGFAVNCALLQILYYTACNNHVIPYHVNYNQNFGRCKRYSLNQSTQIILSNRLPNKDIFRKFYVSYFQQSRLSWEVCLTLYPAIVRLASGDARLWIPAYSGVVLVHFYVMFHNRAIIFTTRTHSIALWIDHWITLKMRGYPLLPLIILLKLLLYMNTPGNRKCCGKTL